jgi:hypothetical protein
MGVAPLYPCAMKITIAGPLTLTWPDAPSIAWGVDRPQPKRTRPMPLAVRCTTEEKIKVTFTPLTHAGHPAQADGPATFTVQTGDWTMAPLDPPEDLSVWLVSPDAAGTAVVLASCDADLGSGVTLIQDTITCDAVHPMADHAELTAEAPVPKT